MNIFNDYEGFIFDLDGTLIDSVNIWRDIDEEFFKRRKIPEPEGFYATVSGLNLRQGAELVIGRFNLDENADDIISEWLDMALDAYSNKIFLKDGAKELLEKLRKAGKKLAVATANGKELYEPCLKNNGIYELFDSFARTDEVARRKGFPDVYELAAQRLGLSAEKCIVFEDILLGVKGAKLGGFSCAAVHHSHSEGDWEEMKRLADISVVSLRELL